MEHNHNINLNLDKVKAHVRKHRTAYWAGSLIVVAGVTYIVTRQMTVRTISVAPVFNNTINNDGSVNFGGHVTKMVERTSDGHIWKKVTEAAAEEGISNSLMSKHLNGKKAHIYGEQYKIIGVGTTG